MPQDHEPHESAPGEPGAVRSRLGLPPRWDRIALVGSLGVLSAVSPMATDMYLASMPEMAQWFGTPVSLVQLSLTAYMVGMAAGQFLLERHFSRGRRSTSGGFGALWRATLRPFSYRRSFTEPAS